MNVQHTLEQRLADALSPLHLEVVNESGQHNVPPGSESHFKVTVVADAFDGKTALQRHRLVYRLLAEELRAGIHALALHTYSPGDWDARLAPAPGSPLCRGGKALEAG